MSITNHVLKNGITIGSAKVISNDLRTKGAAVPGRTLQSISYITLHNTGCVDVKANNFHRSLKTQNNTVGGRQASWTFTVDDIEIYQETKANWETWHAGNSTGNKTSISIEMCMWSDKEKQRKTYENAAKLTAMLLKHYGLGLDKVVQHNKWSGKNCPQYLRAGKHGFNWNWFMDRVKAHYNGTVNNTTSSTIYSVGEYQKDVIITADTLNVRSGRGSEFEKIGSFKKNTKVAVWYIGKAKDGSLWGSCSCNGKTGYIHMGYTKKA
jgi:N-acetylmuramoyl-L-alanine amidase CwlA